MRFTGARLGLGCEARGVFFASAAPQRHLQEGIALMVVCAAATGGGTKAKDTALNMKVFRPVILHVLTWRPHLVACPR
jgi:hypothetical protein